MKKYIPASIIALCYFFISLLVLGDYGVNWDGPWNYKVGNSMLRYIVTGERDYKSLPPCNYLQGSSFIDKSELRNKCPTKYGLLRSVYQDDEYPLDFNYKIQVRGGHPRSFSLFAALSNTIFYRLLGVVDDVDSYRIPVVFVASLMILLVGVWAGLEFGVLASIVASGSLALYPFLFAENQINFKDPPEAFFLTLTIFLVYLGFRRQNKKLLIFSGVAAGLALGIKLNVVFLPFILLPWLICYFYPKKISKAQLAWIVKYLLLIQVIAVVVFYLSWPYLWEHTFNRFISTIQYYLGIGTGKAYQDASFFFLGFNTYPLLYFFYTTPFPTLVLLCIGIISAIRQLLKAQSKVLVLWMLMFFVPLLRLALPGLSSYGGIRQALEFVVGMSLLSGYAAFVILRYFKKRRYPIRLDYIFMIIFVIAAIHMSYKIYNLHPYENLFFNSFVGGLKGAKEGQFPGWENSFGNGYYQGVRWINEHAEKNAKLSFSIVGAESNLPLSKLRPDILVGGKYWSGVSRKGEYIIETNVTFPLNSKYAVAFEHKTLIPVHTITVNDIAIGYVYKNDVPHTKKEFLGQEAKFPTKTVYEDGAIIAYLEKTVRITRADVVFSDSCTQRPSGRVALKKHGSWTILPEPFDEQMYTLPEFSMGGANGNFSYFFLYPVASEVQFTFPAASNCAPEKAEVTLFGLSSVPSE
ncbi:MAG: glycosyltransferase family 39 protein [bacterium]|nr:glycosyltransferase family 39 protein [bacterium]